MNPYTYAPFDPSKFENVPQQLRELPVWVLWKSILDDDGQGKPRKIPYYMNGKARGDTDTKADRKQLVTADDALKAFNPRKYAGLGVVLGKVPDTGLLLSGIDLDNSVDGIGIAIPAQQVIDASNSYAEISPSLHGLKIFGTGDIGKEKTPQLEIYSSGRFFTITGARIQGDQLADLSAAAELARSQLAKHPNAGRAADGKIHAHRNNTLFDYARILWGKTLDDSARWELFQHRATDCVPPLSDRELKTIFKSAKNYAPNFTTTDLGNRDRLVAQHGDDLRYLIGSGWHTWSGARFEPDEKRRVIVLMGNVARGIYAEAAAEDDKSRGNALGKWAHTSQSRARIEAAVALAESHPSVIENIGDYDGNPLLIGLRNGVYDLDRDEFREARREDRITKQMNVEYNEKARAPRWEQFQQEIHNSDEVMVAFKHRLWGYTASGDTREQMFFVPYGEGENGKGTEQETMAAVMGDYALSIEPEVLAKKDRSSNNAASSDIAEMRGMRFIYTSELEEGHQLAEKLMKRLTGQDTIRARFLYQERLSFVPVAKFWISTNYRPEIRGTDHAIWRRVCLIPYTIRFDEAKKDKTLRDKLQAERAGIFNWLVEGFRAWREKGLKPPPTVLAARDEYRADMDRIGNFLRECCKHGPDVKGRTKATELYAAYIGWSKLNGGRWLSSRKFYEHLERNHGLPRRDGNTGRLAEVPGVLVITHHYDAQEMDDGQPQ